MEHSYELASYVIEHKHSTWVRLRKENNLIQYKRISKGSKKMFEKVMMITNTMIMIGVWISLIIFNDWKHLF